MNDYDFLPEERETIILSNDEDKYWEVYSMQKKIINKMAKMNIKPYKIEKDKDGNIISANYKLEYKQISFRKIIQLTEEQKEKRRINMTNMAKLHKNSDGTLDETSQNQI